MSDHRMPARNVHPFPARMAPEIALDACSKLRSGSIVVDPMVGSGTTIFAAAKSGCRAIGVDVDPLAVLMSRVRTANVDVQEFLASIHNVADAAVQYRGSKLIPWIDDDVETRNFVDYWFAKPQQDQLRSISIVLEKVLSSPVRDALCIALSRIIVTKNRGASLARDASHSRPHRVRLNNDYDVFAEFVKSGFRIAEVLKESVVEVQSTVLRADARTLPLGNGCADLIISSPPYLNAIDYLRGHRLSLVWLGYKVSEIRSIRSESVGSERGLEVESSQGLSDLRQSVGGFTSLSPRYQRIVDRYLVDLYSMYREQARVLKRGGRVITVIGNSALRKCYLYNDRAAIAAAEFHNLELVTHRERELPQSKRYLPPPSSTNANSGLDLRMRTESVIELVRK